MARNSDMPVLQGFSALPEITPEAVERYMTANGIPRDPVSQAVQDYNRANPDSPITAQDILDKDRSGLFGHARLLGEGIFDAVTDQLPEDVARIVRGGDISPDQRGTTDEIIARQQRDSARRIPSLQEAQGDMLAKSLYQGPRSVATSMATGIGGMALGGAAGTVVPGVGTALGGMVGAGALSGAAFYRMAKDQFVEEVQRSHMARLGRPLSQEEAERLNAAIDDEATRFGLWEAGPEAVSQFFTAGLLGGAGGKILKGIGLGSVGEAVGKRAITRIPAKLGAEVGEEEVTEGITFMGQEGIRQDMGLRPDAPTVSEFIKEQAGPVAVGALLQMGGMRGAQYLKDRYTASRQARELERQLAAAESAASEGTSPVSPPPTVAPENPEIYERDFASTLRSPEWNAPDVPPDRESWNREARARGWNHLVEDDLAASPETTTAAPGLQPSLDNGEHIDLLRDSPAPENGPSPSMPSTAGMAAGIGGLDPLRASPAADTLQETPLAAHGTPEIPAPPAPLPPLPGVASGIGGLPFSPAQPAPRQPVQIPSLPTQAQLTRTQEKPRADTTAAAEQLGIPGPDAVPQEAQRPELSPAMPQQALPHEAQAPTVLSPLPAPAMQPTPLPESPQAAPQQPDSLPTSARQPETSPVLPPAEPVVIPPELAGLSRKELIRRLPRQLRGKADFMGTEEMRSLLARRLARTQATGPERAGAQPDTAEEKTPLTYGGKPLSHPPIGDARRENTADAVLAGAAERAKAEGRQEMLAAVEDMQRERKSVGVTHDALWQRITDEMLPYASEAGQEEAARTGAAPAQDRESKKQDAPEAVFRVTSDADRPVEKTPDAEESVSPDSLKGKTADAPGAERPEDGISSSGQSPESEQKAERPQIRIRNLVSGKEEYLDIAESPRRNTDDEAARRTDTDRGAAASPAGAFGTIDAPDTVALAAHFSEAFLSGKKFGAIIEARREAGSLLGGTVRPATEAAKAVDEAVELGVTLAARRTVAAMRERHAGDTDIYRALVDLYQRQPRLNVRTSTSIAQQAYSTPAPIAFLASRLAGIDSGTRVFEPTAGLLKAHHGPT